MSATGAERRSALVINAGGRSRRMKRDKALLPVPPEGMPLIRHMLGRLALLALKTVIVVGSDPQLVRQAGLSDSVRYVGDEYPRGGALGGMATGMAAVDDWAVMLACDLPLIRPQVVSYLLSLSRERTDCMHDRWDAIVPLVGGMAQPMLALYNRRCLPAMRQVLNAGQLRAISFLPSVRVRYVSEEELRPFDGQLDSFINVNRPEEWTRALELLQGETPEN